MRTILGYWRAIGERYRAEAQAMPTSTPTAGTTTVGMPRADGPLPPMTQERLPDGSIRKSYNLMSFALAQPPQIGGKRLR